MDDCAITKFWRIIKTVSVMVLMMPLVSQATPAIFSYQGRIVTNSGQGLEHSAVSFEFTVTNPDGSCVIYKEQRDGVDMRNSKGVFDTPIGSGGKLYPLTAGFNLLDAFNNALPITCQGGVIYTPVADEGRKLRVQFFDGTAWRLITPDQTIRSVPYAGFAKEAQSASRLAGFPAANYVRRSEFPVCTGTDVITFDGTNFICAASGAGAGAGTVTSVTVASPLAITNGTTTPHITLPTATGTQSGYLSAADWVSFNNKLSSGSVITGTQVSGNISGSAAGFTGNLGGDVSGTQSATSVNKIKGVAVSTTVPTTNQVLKFDGSEWTPTTLAGADLPSGTATATGTTGRIAYFNGTSNLADSILFQSSGNLGIGTTSPQASIDVQASNAQIRAINSNANGYATLSATTYGGANINNSANLNLYRFRGSLSSPAAPVSGDQLAAITVYGGTAAGSYTPVEGAKILFKAEENFSASAAGTGIGFYTQTSGQAAGSSERMHISSTGTVGIGMTSTSDNLQVRGKTGFGAAGIQNGQVSFYPANVANSYFHLENKNDNTFRLSAGASPGGADLLTITNSGYVGIGNTSPARPLHVTGPMRLTASTTPGSPVAGDIFVDSADANKLKWYDGSTWKDAGGAAATSPTTDASALTSGTLSAARLPAFSGDVTSAAGSSSLTLNTVSVAKGGTGATSFGANKIVATNGTGSALTSWSCPVGNLIKFDSSGVVGCDTIANILGYTPANGANYVAKTGDTMSGALVVVAPGTGTVTSGRFASNPGGAGAANLNALVLDNTNGASNFKNEIKFRSNGSDKWTLGTDPSGAGAQTFYIWDAVASLLRMTITSNGNVGIGTASPASKLDVAGEVKFGNTSSACSGTTEGQQRYNSTSKKMEFCNGTAWTEFGTGSGGGLGVDQTWQTPTRVFNTTYQNTTGKPIMIAVGAGDRSPTTIQVSTDGSTWADTAVAGGYSYVGDTTVVIPNGLYYRCNGGTKIRWTELR